MKLPRLCHRFYAFLFGYFWRPCPECGDNFGGHENNGFHPNHWSMRGGSMVCTRCSIPFDRAIWAVQHNLVVCGPVVRTVLKGDIVTTADFYYTGDE